MKDIQVAVSIHFLYFLNAKLARSRLVFSVAEKVEPRPKFPISTFSTYAKTL